MERRLALGVAGLGRAFTLMLPGLARHPRVRLAAAADPRAEARERFARDFSGRSYETVARMCADGEVDAVYVATPHQHHAEHALVAIAAGKHVLVEKPFVLRLEDGRRVADAARAAGVHVVVGHSHSFDAPIAAARRLIDSGAVGRPRMISALNFTDFLYRPRRPDDLDTERGGGVLFSQAAHQVDILRLLAGSPVRSVRCFAGSWDPARPTEGAYSALLGFEDGCFASLAYSGYARFDSDELCEWVGETGRDKDPASYGASRATLRRAADEAGLRQARNYGGAAYREAAGEPWHEHFGPIVVCCERADVRPTPKGLWIYGDEERRFEPLRKPAVPRREVIDELYEAVVNGAKPLHDAEWGLATLEVCLGMLRSARTGAEVVLK